MSSTGVEPKGPHGPDDVLETSVFPVSSPDNIDEKKSQDLPKDALDSKVHDVSGHSQSDDSDQDSRDAIIITGADASRHLLPMRDDHDSALTFRSIVLSSGLACFQAVMYQIYTFKPTMITIQGTFIVLISYFIGNAWAFGLPRGDKFEARWRAKGNTGLLPFWLKAIKFINPGPWGLKEHAICSITATSASNAAESIQVFAAQDLFYDMPLSATTVILSTISIGLFGYGICGLLRPVAVWHVDAVFWSSLPTVKTLQGLHWQEVKDSKPLRVFWYSFGGMSIYEFFPAYIFPWLNSVSIPCLAAMKATGKKAAHLTRIFGGATNNEGLGLFTVSLDWQYITSFNTSLPLPLQAHMAVGFLVCYVVMIGIYYGNGWGAKSLPFMSTRLLLENGTRYPIAEVFEGGVLNEERLLDFGLPRLTGTFAYALFMANAASTLLYSRYGNGIATNNLSKMLAGLMLPGKPVGNMYFAAWSHNVIVNAVNLSADLKMGEYLKIPPRVMFLTQIWGTILGGFINYAVMISIVGSNRALLRDGDGNSSWSGATMQSYNTNATSWALAGYLYKLGGTYELVPFGLLVGASLVVIHRIFYKFYPKIKNFDVADINFPQFIQFAGYIPYNQSQTCVILSQLLSGFFVQFYLRNYRPRWFRDYSYLVTGAFDGASLTVLFILSFAVFGAGGPGHPFPTWWGNNADGNYDLCPVPE
ncbi:Ff.00g005330.m01.CDS01 [Fusarium sp. VM40]|nr:Ff.00g005330.m01.CDS01 [Fusarium sp. VM40]